jgi:hypothetical protein
MNRHLPLVFTLVGLAVGAIALLLLPSAPGRFEYMVQVVDERPVGEGEITPALESMRAVRALTMRSPTPDLPRQVLLVPRLWGRLRNEDCALGILPEDGLWSALAGSESGLERGSISLAGHPVSIPAILQRLTPLFDESLVMNWSPAAQAALSAGGWEGEASYLLFADTWEERNRLLAELKSAPGALPSPGAQILSPAEKPLLSSSARQALAALLICVGLLLLALQLRGLSREDLARRFGRS